MRGERGVTNRQLMPWPLAAPAALGVLFLIAPLLGLLVLRAMVGTAKDLVRRRRARRVAAVAGLRDDRHRRIDRCSGCRWHGRWPKSECVE